MIRMVLLKKNHNKAYQFYRQRIVCEHKGAIGLVYMLQHFSQKVYLHER